MMLKNRDGSPVVLSHPNPIVAGQERWDAKAIIIHNHYGNEFISESLNQQIEPIVEHEPTFLEDLKNTKEEMRVDPPKVKREKLNNIVIMHCLPAVYKIKKDELYGETFKRKTWGEKITFEGIIIHIGDLEMQFWTNYQITEGSIVYPTRYASQEGVLGERRWWKVSNFEEKDGGFIVKTIPSVEQPSFS